MSKQLAEISPSKLLKAHSDYVLIDIRRASEWQYTGIIEGSHLLTFFNEYGEYDLEKWLEDFEKCVPSKETPFVLICAHANRTLDVGLFLLNKLNYSQACHLQGGIVNWIQEGKPTQSILNK